METSLLMVEARPVLLMGSPPPEARRIERRAGREIGLS